MPSLRSSPPLNKPLLDPVSGANAAPCLTRSKWLGQGSLEDAPSTMFGAGFLQPVPHTGARLVPDP